MKSVVNNLPRPTGINESQNIPIKFKSKLSYKHHYQFQNVRRRKVLEAAKYLVETSERFQNEQIDVQENWLKNVNSAAINEHNDWQEFIISSTNQIDELNSSDPLKEPAKNTEQALRSEATSITDSKTNDNDDNAGCEVEDHPSGVTGILLQEPDLPENVEKIIGFPPGIFMDKESECLSFPIIYCEHARADNKERAIQVHYSMQMETDKSR